MAQINDLIQICKQKQHKGDNLEDILQFLRENNCDKGTSISILLKIKYLPQDKAQFTKHLVHFSKTWEDLRESHEDWHEKLLDVLQEDKN